MKHKARKRSRRRKKREPPILLTTTEKNEQPSLLLLLFSSAELTAHRFWPTKRDGSANEKGANIYCVCWCRRTRQLGLAQHKCNTRAETTDSPKTLCDRLEQRHVQLIPAGISLDFDVIVAASSVVSPVYPLLYVFDMTALRLRSHKVNRHK